MLKKILFLLLLFCLAPATAVQAATASLASAQKLVEQGKDGDAIEQLQQLVKQQPENYQAWFLLGVTEARHRRFHDAIASFRQVISLRPMLAEPHNNLAVIYNELGDFKAAVKELEASLALNPNYVTAQENIGDLYLKLAADAYRKALARGDNAELRQRYERLLRVRINDSASTEVVAMDVEEQAAEVADKAAGVEETGEQAATAAPAPESAKTEKQPVQNSEPSAKAADEKNPAVDINDALKALEMWRAAWSRQDLAAFFVAYDEAFDFGKRFESLQNWKDYKRRVIKKRKFINVTLENIETTVMAGDVIRVVFLQHFRSDSFNSDDIKEMLLRKRGGEWKIIHEVSR